MVCHKREQSNFNIFFFSLPLRFSLSLAPPFIVRKTKVESEKRFFLTIFFFLLDFNNTFTNRIKQSIFHGEKEINKINYISHTTLSAPIVFAISIFHGQSRTVNATTQRSLYTFFIYIFRRFLVFVIIVVGVFHFVLVLLLLLLFIVLRIVQENATSNEKEKRKKIAVRYYTQMLHCLNCQSSEICRTINTY